ncbi:MAG: cytochrome c biogenesis protein DipZ, partial [Legionellaceae bacterium]
LPLTYGFWGGVSLGGLLAILWTPCVGPIVAAVIVQIAIQKTNHMSLLTLLTFALGAATPMLILILYGFKIKESFGFFKTHALMIRQCLGGIILLNLGYMISLEMGYLPSQALVADNASIRTADYLEKGVWRPYPAPEISGITSWINSTPLNLADLKGHVVLVDFWTYSCINCIRTVPYLNRWYEQYHQQGLILIGVHSPEFEFEKNPNNVAQAVKRLGIQYPVALDNAFATWRNFSNHYWPAHYLIDKQGKVVYEHFGEGDEAVTEHNIKFLLGLRDLDLKKKMKEGATNLLITPEIYLGSARSKADVAPHLDKGWATEPDKIVSVKSDAALSLSFYARRVFMVMGPGGKTPSRVTLRLNGKPLRMHAGKDVVQGKILVDRHGLYEAVVLPKTTSGTLQVMSDEPGLEIFTFTFGR